MIKLIDINEASSLFGVSNETMRRWDRSGKLKAIRVGKRGRRRYNKEELLELINNK